MREYFGSVRFGFGKFGSVTNSAQLYSAHFDFSFRFLWVFTQFVNTSNTDL